MSGFLEDLERWMDEGKTREEIVSYLMDYEKDEVVHDFVVLIENLRYGHVHLDMKVKQEEDLSHLSNPHRFDDPANWPSCPLCGARPNSQDGNHWNVFHCPWHGYFTLGAGPMPNGMVMIKKGST
jgi:hypothetical protein